MQINKNEITQEMLEKAMNCKSAEELMALAKSTGFELTKVEAEAYMAELADVELDGKEMKNVAGGDSDGPYVECFTDCLTDCVNRYT